MNKRIIDNSSPKLTFFSEMFNWLILIKDEWCEPHQKVQNNDLMPNISVESGNKVVLRYQK
jgi:hypothetical protein